MKWALELGQYSLVFQPLTYSLGNAREQSNDTPEVGEHTLAVPTPPNGDFWHLHVDGASNWKGSRVGVVLVTPDNSMLEQAITLGFKAPNNEAE
ncbi:hypothetical protein ACFX1Q_037529 [Malus domestica]